MLATNWHLLRVSSSPGAFRALIASNDAMPSSGPPSIFTLAEVGQGVAELEYAAGHMFESAPKSVETRFASLANAAHSDDIVLASAVSEAETFFTRKLTSSKTYGTSEIWVTKP